MNSSLSTNGTFSITANSEKFTGNTVNLPSDYFNSWHGCDYNHAVLSDIIVEHNLPFTVEEVDDWTIQPVFVG